MRFPCLLLPTLLLSSVVSANGGRSGPVLGDAALGLGLAWKGDLRCGEDFALFLVSEAGEGRDLNGDGDLADGVLHDFDARTRGTRNLGLALARSLPKPVAGRVAFLVHESANDADLNGDGDRVDLVAHVYDHRTGLVTNLGLAVSEYTPDLEPGTDLLVLSVREKEGSFFGATVVSGQGLDLNGDGDEQDEVVHVHRFADGSTTNLRLAGSSAAAVDGERTAFSVQEAFQGRDLNGDGDLADAIVHVLDGDGLRNTGLAGVPLLLRGADLVLARSEAATAEDHNGDGDTFDEVLQRIDLATGAVTSLSFAVAPGGGGPLVDERWLAVSVSESRSGATDLNGDGDALDTVPFVYDSWTGALTSTGAAGSNAVLRDGLLAFWVDEAKQGGADLNGNGTSADAVLFVHDLETGETTNTARGASLAPTLRLPEIRSQDGFVAAFTYELVQQADLNEDGDRGDRIAFAFDRRTGLVRDLGLAVRPEALELGDGGLVAAAVYEVEQGRDLDGDGQLTHRVHVLGSAASGRSTSLRVPASSASERQSAFGSGFAVLMVNEASQGADLNGDGDALDTVPFVLGVAPR